MPALEDRIRAFLAETHIAVAGVSFTREDAANGIYRKLRAAGYRVYGINPGAAEFDGDRCFPSLAALPVMPGGLVLVTRPAVAEQLVRECAALGIRRVWMHCSLGTRPILPGLAAGITSVSTEAVRFCEAHGIAVIAGACPLMFIPPVDAGHTCMRLLLRAAGSLSAPEPVTA
jgi:predicted CoA-binding protein